MLNYEDVAGAIREVLETRLQIPVQIGAIPPEGGLCVTVGSGTVQRDFAGNAYVKLRLGINAKSPGQYEAIHAIHLAHELVIDLRGEADDGSWTINGISVASTPEVIQTDMMGNYITASTIEVRCVFWKEANK